METFFSPVASAAEEIIAAERQVGICWAAAVCRGAL
jgi:hypothetical protein